MDRATTPALPFTPSPGPRASPTAQSQKVELFVPGRVALFGEHSDWAGGFRRFNSALVPGRCIVTGTNQGLFATAVKHHTHVILRSVLLSGEEHTFAIPMEPEKLLEEASKGGFFSYACGVAYQIQTRYHVRGIDIDNYATTLPACKGLSSSAAICVLVARAFNRIYDLKMTIRGEMELAYYGEICTPSRCGRMDQCCAFGSRPILMTFDGDLLDTKPIDVGGPIHILIVDLGGKKDTTIILRDLGKAFPFASNELEEGLQRLLGEFNKSLTERAMVALAGGDAETLGALMTEAQAEFDKYAIPACPSQLTSPLLHALLQHPPLQQFVYGGKGVGSQGDGTAQLLCKSGDAATAAMEIIQRDFPGMSSYPQVLGNKPHIRTAVIPTAGISKGLYPASKALSPGLFPMMDSDGLLKPAVLILVEQALSAGVDEVVLIVNEHDQADYEQFFNDPLPPSVFHSLPPASQAYAQRLLDMGRQVRIVVQASLEGFGHAVLQAREIVGDHPFLLMLGDHLYQSTSNAKNCVAQLLGAFDGTTSVIGACVSDEDVVPSVAVLTGTFSTPTTLAVHEVVEKPTIEYARSSLATTGVPEGKFLTAFGLYVLKPEIFGMLQDSVAANVRFAGQIGLTHCLDRMRKECGLQAFVVSGSRFDIGLDAPSYLHALTQYGRK